MQFMYNMIAHEEKIMKKQYLDMLKSQKILSSKLKEMDII